MWQTVHNAATGGYANVDENAAEQLKGLGWLPVGEPTEVPRPLTADALNGLVPPAIEGAPADVGMPLASDKAAKSPGKKAADAASEGDVTRVE